MTTVSRQLVLLAILVGCAPPEPKADATHPELVFFNTISAKLEIELTAPAQPLAAGLENKAAPAEATIARIKLYPKIFNPETAEFRPLTQKELESIAFRGAEITLRGQSEHTVTHSAPNGRHFTVAQLLAAVEQTERQTRGKSEWYGGVDVHHCFFEGLHAEERGIWLICWGS